MNFHMIGGLLALLTTVTSFSALAAENCEERAVLVTEQTFKALLFENGNLSGTQIRFIDYAQCARQVNSRKLVTYSCEVHASCTTAEGDMVFGITLDSRCRIGLSRTILVDGNL